MANVVPVIVFEMKVVAKFLSALGDLQTADAALTQTVATTIADWAQALAAANTANDPAIEAVVNDMNADVTSLTGSDPSTVVTNPSPPATA